MAYAYLLFWQLEYLETSRVRLSPLLRFQRTPLQGLQIENHRILELERLETIESNTLIFLMAWRGPVAGPGPQKRVWATWFLVVFSTCLEHIISIVTLCKNVSAKKPVINGTGILKAFYGLHWRLEFFFFWLCFLKVTKSKIFFLRLLHTRLCAWHSKWYLISASWVTWVIRELPGIRICSVGSMITLPLKAVNKPRRLFT